MFFAVNPAKGPHWGLPFQLLIVFGALAGFQSALDFVASRDWPSLSSHAVAVAWILPGLAFLQPWFPRYGIPKVLFADFIFEAHNRIVEDIAKQRPLAPVIVNLTAVGDINTDSVNWMTNKRGLVTTFTSDFLFGNLESRHKQAEEADLIVAPEFGAPGFYKTQASTKEADLMLQFLRDDPRFLQIDAIPAVALGGKSVFVFVNHPFRGWTAQSGIGNVEGPFPKASLPRGRWASGPKASLMLEGIRPGAVTISGTALTQAKNQRMEVDLGEKHLGTVEFPESMKSETFSFSAAIDDPTQLIILTFLRTDETTSGRANAVLFKSLVVTSDTGKP